MKKKKSFDGIAFVVSHDFVTIFRPFMLIELFAISAPNKRVTQFNYQGDAKLSVETS